MKKIIVLAALALMCQTMVFAQKEKNVKESDVPVRYVKDFQNQAKDATNASWTMAVDSSAYMVTFINSDGDKQAIRFTPKSTEERYYIEEKYYPHDIRDSVASMFPKHKITCIYVRNLKGKMTYQCRIARKKGFLFCKKETDVKVISFETSCKIIEVLDEQ
ncbi:MAG: hypothetical protein II633_00815 [Bacteroidales bacterium]|nr:hypothetical protein [Bacteroidales bacterium]MBR3488166.1 hypothetical protein [Bacteroidales bacterium]MBR6990856.1 hypothetical protein [Bacteroidales bacterium]